MVLPNRNNSRSSSPVEAEQSSSHLSLRNSKNRLLRMVALFGDGQQL